MAVNNDVVQLATIKIDCNGEGGTAVLYYLDQSLEYMYVFTAKHCLMGKEFDKEFVNTDIVLSKILNENDGSWHSYRLTETDIANCSPSNEEDIALLIIPKQRILDLTGKTFAYPIVDSTDEIESCLIRGFANFNNNEVDRPINLKFVETTKGNEWGITLKVQENLDTFYESALENVKGLSGSGIFAKLKDRLYLMGIVHDYEEKGIFLGTSIMAYNKLIPTDRYNALFAIKPELNDAIIDTFQKIEENRESISQRTRDTVANVNIQRDLKGLQTLLNTSRIAVLHGKPGVGKSAMAKSLVSEMRKDRETTVITFTPEQLYTDKITEALSKAGYRASFEQIASSPLSTRRVVIWVESFEKLIESGYEGACHELIAFINKHPRFLLLITIRDYLLQKFKITYHYELPANNIYYQVKEFNETELNQIKEQIPQLTTLLDNSKISALLKIPYYLDKATRILPQLLQENQLDEVGFKRLMWEHIVEAGVKERGTTFLEIALKRARALSMYTSFETSAMHIDALVKDNILQVEESELRNRYSPSHDILEDWALIRHIKQQKQEASSPQTFISSLENSPALRRAFRLWLNELYKQDTGYASTFSNTILQDTSTDQSWKDELVVTILRSENAHVLFNTLHNELLDNGGFLLKHYMLLLETGCKILGYNDNDFSNLLPTGSGWDATISFIRQNWKKANEFKGFEFSSVSAIESWSKQLPEFKPESLPPSAADSAYLLLDYLYRHQDLAGRYEGSNSDNFYFKKYVAILFKLTSVAQPEVEELIEAAVQVESQKHTKWHSKDFLYYIRDYVTEGMLSDQICKYFPDKVFSIALEEWKEIPDKEASDRSMFMTRQEPDAGDFGLDTHMRHDTEPPSGYRTFFYWMFLYHSDNAIEFLITFLNEAFEHNQKVLLALKQKVLNVEVVYESGVTRHYIGYREYWTMYRDSYSRNKTISSLLMALESSLLHLADADSTNYTKVKEYLSQLIYGTNNVAVLAVVTSIIQAHPELLDENSVSLLGIPDFFHWDVSRSTSELVNLGDYSKDPFLKNERITANKRTHRRKYHLGLVGFVADYMFYYQALNTLLFKQVDNMWEQAPTEDPIWRKFLFDMDARKYRFVPVDDPEYPNHVQVVPDYDSAVEEAISQPEDFHVPKATRVWADNVFKGEYVEDQTYETWKNGYQYIQRLNGRNEILIAPGTMATLGLRDYFDQLTEDEAQWCKNIILEQNKRLLSRKDNYIYDPYVLQETHIIYGLPLLFKFKLEDKLEADVKQLLFELLISHNDEKSRIHLEASIVQHLWPIHPEFAQSCWCGILSFRRLSRLANRISNPYYNFHREEEDDELEGIIEREEWNEDWRQLLIASVLNGTITEPDISVITLDSATSRNLDDALRLIPSNTDIQIHRAFIQKIFELLLSHLNNEKYRYRSNYFESRQALKFFYARYLLAQPKETAATLFKELLNLTKDSENFNQTDKAKEFLYDLVKENIAAVISGSSVENFWHLWTILKEWILEIKLPQLFPLLLMDYGWNQKVDYWSTLENKNFFYKDLITNYGFNDINASFRLIAGIGFKNFMPESIAWAASMLTSQNSTNTKTDLLEGYTQKAFYNYGSVIKSDKQFLTDFLSILDFLIQARSTKAYMLKEELIQYK